MTRQGSKSKKAAEKKPATKEPVEKEPVEQEPGLLVQLEGATVDEVIIAGEQWVPPAEHEAALTVIGKQAAELDQLKKAQPSNGKPCEDTSGVKQHLRCPSCWGRDRGRAARMKWNKQVNGPLQKRCYVCNECGTEWVVEVRAEVEDGIEYKRTRIAEVRERGDKITDR